MTTTLEPPGAIDNPWAMTADEVLDALGTDDTLGLTSAEAERRLAIHGLNAIPEPKVDPLWMRYWGQLTGDAVVRLLLIGGIVSLALGDFLEGGAIIVMLNIMAGFGLWQEGKATDAARSLRRGESPLKLVVRDGKRQELPVDQIVPGDVIYLPTGAIAPADGRLIAAVNAEKDTSKLTGESLPVEVGLGPVPPTTVVNEQRNMIHRGDAVISGNATMVVTLTGAATEIGKIAVRLGATEDPPTPLDEQLDSLGDAMAKIFLWIAVIVIGAGLVREFLAMAPGALTAWEVVRMLKQSFINAVALIIAAIPEGLPAVLTITLAIATKTMVRRKALVRRPKAVEGGGSMTVLLTDKTGTLTANQMSVEQVYLNGHLMSPNAPSGSAARDEVLSRILRIARLCNNNSSATESAMIRWVEQSGLSGVGDVETRAVEHGFDSSLKRMSTVHATGEEGRYDILTKGAPEQVLALCGSIHQSGRDVPMDDAAAESVLEAVRELASRGLRVIALADRVTESGHTLARDQAETDLTFVGLIGLMDPPRDDVAPAIASLTRAGIRTVMVTGDNPLTAYQIAKSVGIIEKDMPMDQAVITGQELSTLKTPSPTFLARLQTVRVFARVTPEHKADIVALMRKEGFIVGMTGDGVNDAIALKESDVGFAMGNGTDVAREASAIILMDSRFGTIPHAVEEGRNVLYRIRLYLSYILSGNGCEVGAFVVAYGVGIPIPLTALVLLVINFATDSFPALAMAFEPGEPDVMARPPRRRGLPFITSTMWIHIGVQTVAATAVIMGVYLWLCPRGTVDVKDQALMVARSAAFMTYIFQKLYRAFTARSLTRNIWEIGLFRNPWSVGAVFISLAIAFLAVYTPVVNTAMGLAALSPKIILITAAVGFIPPIVEEITKLTLKKR